MDRDTLQDDLDLILGPSPESELPGEWDWEPPLGTVAPALASAAEPEETEETEETDAEATEDPVDEDEDD